MNGQKLTCATCHQPDVSGIRHEPVTFAAHCQACHSLQFDVRQPDLELPHGSPVAVRAFLNSLPTQYADAARRAGVTNVEEFVTGRLAALRAEVIAGRDFESDVFFTADRRAPGTKSPYPGCVKCHEVTAGTPPQVTAPRAEQRWLWGGEFNHATHRAIACVDCHAAQQSKFTSDLILPGKDTCAGCHGKKAGVASSCITCHNFHRVEK